jgi:hypothetical protein
MSTSQQLQPVLAGFAKAERARGIIFWLNRSPNAALLSRLASTGEELTHELLDELPFNRNLHYVREVLVHTSVLPERNEDLERIPPWLGTLLADRPQHHARLIRPFAHWFLPGRPAGPATFSHKLPEHGIRALPARNAALAALASDIPPPILADILGLHINTAVRWAAVTKRDWTDYLTARAEGLRRGNTAPSQQVRCTGKASVPRLPKLRNGVARFQH